MYYIVIAASVWVWLVGAFVAADWLDGLLDRGWPIAVGIVVWPLTVPAFLVYAVVMMADDVAREEDEWIAAGRDPYSS